MKTKVKIMMMLMTILLISRIKIKGKDAGKDADESKDEDQGADTDLRMAGGSCFLSDKRSATICRELSPDQSATCWDHLISIQGWELDKIMKPKAD